MRHTLRTTIRNPKDMYSISLRNVTRMTDRMCKYGPGHPIKEPCVVQVVDLIKVTAECL